MFAELVSPDARFPPLLVSETWFCSMSLKPFRPSPNARSPRCSEHIPQKFGAYHPNTRSLLMNATQTNLLVPWCPERDSNPHDLTIRGF